MIRFTLGFVAGVIAGRPVLSALDKAFGPIIYHTVDKSLSAIARGFESAAQYIDNRIGEYNQEGGQ